MRYKVEILEEGSHPLPRCPKYDMFVTCQALNGKHQVTTMCSIGEDQKQERWWDEEAQIITEVDFQAYERPLLVVS